MIWLVALLTAGLWLARDGDRERPQLVVGEVGDCSDLASYTPLFQAAASDGVPWQVLAAQACAESGLYPWALSYVGAAGISQIMPATARDWGLRVASGVLDERGREFPTTNDPNLDERFNEAKAISTQGRIIARNLRALGTLEMALGAYLSGVGSIRARGMNAANWRYVTKIQHYLASLPFEGASHG